MPTAFCPVASCLGADLGFLGREDGAWVLCCGLVASCPCLAAGGAGLQLAGGPWAYRLAPGGSALASWPASPTQRPPVASASSPPFRGLFPCVSLHVPELPYLDLCDMVCLSLPGPVSPSWTPGRSLWGFHPS